MSVRTGLDRVIAEGLPIGKSTVAALCNHSSVSRDLIHITTFLHRAESEGALKVRVFRLRERLLRKYRALSTPGASRE